MSKGRIIPWMFALVWMLVFATAPTTAAQSAPATSGGPSAPHNDSDGPAIMPEAPPDRLVDVRLESESQSVRVAERIEIHLIVEAPSGTKVTMPITGPKLGDFEVVDTRLIHAIPIDNDPVRRRWTFTATLESMESGDFTIPPMEVLYRLSEDSANPAGQKSIRSEPLSIEVMSLLSEDQDPRAFRGIKDSIRTAEVAPARGFRLPIAVAGLVTTLVLVAAIVWWRHRRTPEPIELAFQEIDQIETKASSGGISISDAYARLSSVLRLYLADEFGFPATALSTAELDKEMSARSCPPSTLAQLNMFLSEADEVKFSGRSRSFVSLTVSPAARVREIIEQIHQMSVSQTRGE